MLETCNGNVEDIRAFRGNGVIAYLIATYIQLGFMQFHAAGSKQRRQWKPMPRHLKMRKCADIER